MGMRNHLILSRIEGNSESIHTTDSSSVSGSIGKEERGENGLCDIPRLFYYPVGLAVIDD